MNDPRTVLLAEDDEVDVMLLRRAFATAGVENPLEVARDGQEAIEYLERRLHPEPRALPALLILDLKMPRRSGLETLRWVRDHPALRTLPVVIFSSSAHHQEVRAACEIGVNAFLVKPPSLTERAEIARFLKEWLRLNHTSANPGAS